MFSPSQYLQIWYKFPANLLKILEEDFEPPEDYFDILVHSPFVDSILHKCATIDTTIAEEFSERLKRAHHVG